MQRIIGRDTAGEEKGKASVPRTVAGKKLDGTLPGARGEAHGFIGHVHQYEKDLSAGRLSR